LVIIGDCYWRHAHTIFSQQHKSIVVSFQRLLLDRQ
jgi:hypothetical protein